MIGISQVKGITLIETVIAVSILAVGIVGVLQAFPLGAHLAKTAQMSTIATELGQAKIEHRGRLRLDARFFSLQKNYSGQLRSILGFGRS